MSLDFASSAMWDQECPKTVENFTVHSKNGYYVLSPEFWGLCVNVLPSACMGPVVEPAVSSKDNIIFHRVIQVQSELLANICD